MILLEDISQVHVVGIRLHARFLHRHANHGVVVSKSMVSLHCSGCVLLVQRGHGAYPILAAGHLQPVPRYILGISAVYDILCSRDKLAISLILKHLSQDQADSITVSAGGRA